MHIRRYLTLLSGLLACGATAFAFRMYPVDLSTPITWLWMPLFGGAVFVNAFGLAAITLMVPWEMITHYAQARKLLHVLDRAPKTPLGEIPATGPAITTKRIA